jgi:hypothetical protein
MSWSVDLFPNSCNVCEFHSIRGLSIGTLLGLEGRGEAYYEGVGEETFECKFDLLRASVWDFAVGLDHLREQSTHSLDVL